MDTFSCPYCGQTHPITARFCSITGKSLSEISACPQCGSKVAADWNVCAACGQPLKSAEAEPISQNRRKLRLGIGLAIMIGLLITGYWLLSNRPRVLPVSNGAIEGETETPVSLGSNQIFSASETSTLVQSPSITISPISQLPVLIGTPVPWPSKAISIDNANRIVEIARWGDGKVFMVRYTPDGKYVVAATSIGVYLFDAKTLEVIKFIEFPGGVYRLDISPDGTLLALSQSNVLLWRISDGEIIHSYDYPGPWNVKFSPDGKTLAIASGSTIYLTRVLDGTLIHKYEGHQMEITSIAYSSDSKTIASGSNDGTIKLWSYADGNLLRTIAVNSSVNCISFSPDDQIIASGSYDNYLRIWHVADGRLIKSLGGNINEWDTKGITAVDFSPDGSIVASATAENNTIWLWRVADGTLMKTLSGHQYNLLSVDFSPDGENLVSTSRDNSIRLWRVADGVQSGIWQGVQNEVIQIAFSPNGKVLAAVSEDGTAILWQVANGTFYIPSRLRSILGWENCLEFSPDGSLIATMSSQSIYLWNAADGSIKGEISVADKKKSLKNIHFSPDGQFLAANFYGDSAVRIWRVAGGALVRELIGDNDFILSFAFSPDGRTLATGQNDGSVYLWDWKDGALIQHLKAYTGDVQGLTYSPDGAILVSGGTDTSYRVKLWNSRDYSLIRILELSSSGVFLNKFAFSPDSKILAAGGLLWRVSDGNPFPIRLGGDIAFSPDGIFIAVGGYDATVRLWGVPEFDGVLPQNSTTINTSTPTPPVKPMPTKDLTGIE